MKIKSLSILWLFLFWAVFCGRLPAGAGQGSTPADPGPATGNMAASAQKATSGPTALTLENAVASALAHNPDLIASKFDTRLAETDKIQAGLFPNPELGFEYEDFDDPEKTLTIGYLLELGGKRGLRMDVADAAAELASAEFDAARAEIVFETAGAFIDVLVAQENYRITIEKETLAHQVYETSRERVLAGRVSPMEAVTAEIKQSKARLDVRQAEDELRIARTRLAAMWGGPETDVQTADGNFDRIQPVPAFDALTAAVDRSPTITAKLSQIKIADHRLSLEKRNRIPDLSLSGGMKKIEAEDDTIYIVGLSLPIPLFDRNQAGVARAAVELDQQAAALAALKNRLFKDLKIAYQTLETAYQQVITLQTDILPSAQKVLDAVKEGYQEGEFSFLDMLEAQSTLYESHESYVQALGRYHHAVIDLENLLGLNLSRLDLN